MLIPTSLRLFILRLHIVEHGSHDEADDPEKTLPNQEKNSSEQRDTIHSNKFVLIANGDCD